MDKKGEKILANFHNATNLNLYVVNTNFETINRFTTPLAPQLTKEIINKIKDIKSELSIFLITNKSSIGIFKYHDKYIIGWNTNFTVGGRGGYLRKAPLLEFNQFSHIMKCLYYMLFNKWPETNQKETTFKIGDNINSSQDSLATYEGYLAERELLDAVSKGNLKLYNQRFIEFSQKGNFGKFGQNNNRNAKDLAIAATTLYTRAAIQGGVPVSEAYNLSDNIIKHIEQDSSIMNYYEYSRAIGEIFINRVYRTKRTNLTSIVYRAQEYIYANYNIISNINEISQIIGVSTSYLQHLFKKETGKSLIEFINEEKIKQAKHDLIFSDKSIDEIANDLGYSNQSQLSTLFKKNIGISPIQYRKQYK